MTGGYDGWWPAKDLRLVASENAADRDLVIQLCSLGEQEGVFRKGKDTPYIIIVILTL